MRMRIPCADHILNKQAGNNGSELLTSIRTSWIKVSADKSFDIGALTVRSKAYGSALPPLQSILED